jgi:hypothetical protein
MNMPEIPYHLMSPQETFNAALLAGLCICDVLLALWVSSLMTRRERENNEKMIADQVADIRDLRESLKVLENVHH